MFRRNTPPPPTTPIELALGIALRLVQAAVIGAIAYFAVYGFLEVLDHWDGSSLGINQKIQ